MFLKSKVTLVTTVRIKILNKYYHFWNSIFEATHTARSTITSDNSTRHINITLNMFGH